MLHDHAVQFMMNMIRNLLASVGPNILSLYTEQCAVMIMKLIAFFFKYG